MPTTTWGKMDSLTNQLRNATLLKLKIREINALKAEAEAWEVYMTAVAKEVGTLPAAGDMYKAALVAEEAAIEAGQALELF